MRRSLGWLVAVCLAAVIPTARTGAEQSGSAPPHGVAIPVENGLLRLSVEDAVRLAIERNLDVQLLRFDPLEAAEDLGAAWGAYDPQVYGNGGYINTNTPTASAILPGQSLLHEEDWTGEAGFQGQIPWLGGSYQAGYHGQETVTNSVISVLSPQFTTGFTANVTVPLLRGLFWSNSWTLVRVARIGVDATRYNFASQLMDVVERTENAYWGLIAAQDSTRVAQQSLETARALLDQTRAQYDVGVVSRVEVVQAEAGVADREFVLIRTQAQEQTARDVLVDVVLGPYLEPDTEIQVELTDRPEAMPVREVSAAAATEHAMARRPDLAAARKDIERREVELKYADNQRLPQLDVTGTYGQLGLAGRRNPVCGFAGFLCGTGPVPGIGGPTFGDANDHLFGVNTAETYGVQGVLTIPLGNNTARHAYDKAGLELRRSQTGLKRLEQQIVSDIRRGTRNLSAAVQGIEAAERGEAAAAEQLRAERVRLEHGESTPFDVLLKQEDYVRAQSQKIFAQQTYHDSITALDRAQGTILERHQIVIEDAAPLR